jgi:hypothetical protein
MNTKLDLYYHKAVATDKKHKPGNYPSEAAHEKRNVSRQLSCHGRLLTAKQPLN